MDINEIRNTIRPILKKHDVRRASIFGSWARHEEKENSDLDIIIEFQGKKTLLDLAALKMDLEDTLNRDIDVITYRSLNSKIRDRVIKEQVAIL